MENMLYPTVGDFDVNHQLSQIPPDVHYSSVMAVFIQWSFVGLVTLLLLNILLSIVVEGYLSYVHQRSSKRTFSFSYSIVLVWQTLAYNISNYLKPILLCHKKQTKSILKSKDFVFDSVNPHTCFDRLNWLVAQDRFTLHTFWLRQELREMFSEHVVDKMIWILRRDVGFKDQLDQLVLIVSMTNSNHSFANSFNSFL